VIKCSHRKYEDLRETAKGNMRVMGTGETLCVIEGSCVLSSRSHTSTLPSFLEM